MTLDNGVLRKMKIAVAAITIVTGIIGGGWATYAWGQDYHSRFAQAAQVSIQFKQTNLSILEAQKADYEDQIFLLSMVINSGDGEATDRTMKERLESRLEEVRNKIAAIVASMQVS